jgi:luciferase family oxidoreductase group 1
VGGLESAGTAVTATGVAIYVPVSDAPVPLSVLDLAPVSEGSAPGDALANSLDLARRTETLGFHRYWVAEHHNLPGIASSAPAVLIAHLAAGTERIRLGSGGVMLPNHAPLVVAEQFGMLEALHPGRIDLGLGRAPGTDQRTAWALRQTAERMMADDFPDQLMELVAYFEGRVEGIHAVPGEGSKPAIWLLGSSGFSAQVAGMLGLPFAFAHHFSPRNTLPAIELYRSRFSPSETLAEPYLMICTGVVCAPTDEEAQFLFGSNRLSIRNLRLGAPGRLPSPEEAARVTLSHAEAAVVDDHTAGYIVGGPDAVRSGIEQLLAETAANELMISTSTFRHPERLRSYELVAELFSGVPARR